jgi:hypothetical protein
MHSVRYKKTTTIEIRPGVIAVWALIIYFAFKALSSMIGHPDVVRHEVERGANFVSPTPFRKNLNFKPARHARQKDVKREVFSME